MSIHWAQQLTEVKDIDALAAFSPAFAAVAPSPEVSKRYGFVSTRELVTALGDYGFAVRDVRGSRRGTSRQFGTHEVRMVKTDAKIQTGGVIPEIVLLNSHDRSSRARVDLGFWRIACDNGLIVGGEMDYGREMVHIGDLHGRLGEFLGSVAEHAGKVSEHIVRFSQRRLTDAEIATFVSRAADIRANASSPLNMDMVRRNEDAGNDLWSVFNRVQENVLRGGFSMKTAAGKRTTARPIKDVRRSRSINIQLWNLAEEFLTN